MFALARSLVEKWPFTLAMASREMKGLNKGALLGMGWLVLRPFIQVAAYVTIVSFVFGARLGPASSPFDYALHVLAGLFGWHMLQRGLEDSTSLIRDRMEILKQIAYPIETLPVTAFLTSAIGPAVLLGVYIILAGVSGKLELSILLLPVPMALLFVMLLGLSWFFMVIGAVLKDLREVVSVLMALLIYLSPVLLSESMVPPPVWRLILLNPLSHVVLAFRDVLQGGFHPTSWAIFAALSFSALAVGSFVVTRAKVRINEYI
jgi:lipopolysaccharide transport system permease protein